MVHKVIEDKSSFTTNNLAHVSVHKTSNITNTALTPLNDH